MTTSRASLSSKDFHRNILEFRPSDSANDTGISSVGSLIMFLPSLEAKRENFFPPRLRVKPVLVRVAETRAQHFPQSLGPHTNEKFRVRFFFFFLILLPFTWKWKCHSSVQGLCSALMVDGGEANERASGDDDDGVEDEAILMKNSCVKGANAGMVVKLASNCFVT